MQRLPQTFNDLYNWSVGDSRENFWDDFWDYAKLIHEGTYNQVIEPGVRMDHIPRWFCGVRLNFAENILFSNTTGGTEGKEDSKVACTEVREGCTEIRNVTWQELRQKVGRLSSAMRARGVCKGDRVAVVSSNSVDTLSVFLAVTSLGALFSSSSTDMGSHGILDRLMQIRPKWLFVDDGALYNGSKLDLMQKMEEIVQGMRDVGEFQGIVSMPRWEKPLDVARVSRCMTLKEYLKESTSDKLQFERVEFADPFLIVYSSGTTGAPKCIVHSVGGVLISAAKEGGLHSNIGHDSVNLQYTTVSRGHSKRGMRRAT